MPIGDQFSGLNMDNLIGAPLRATADATLQLADATANFINRVGFDSHGNTRTASFKYYKKGYNEDGSINNDELKVDVPLLAIVPIPNLQVDEVNILFDMEVKQSERDESANDMSGSMTGEANLGIFKVKVSGSVSSHSSHTRSSDQSAKYHVDVRATNHGTPEGLARVLDMMAATLAPSVLSSTPVDESGQALEGESKARVESLKRLRLEKQQLDTAISSANQIYENDLQIVNRAAQSIQNQYAMVLQQKLNTMTEEQKKEDNGKIDNNLLALNNNWQQFRSQLSDTISIAADSTDAVDLLSLVTLQGSKEDGTLAPLTTSDTNLAPLTQSFQKAVESKKKELVFREQLQEKDKEYQTAMMPV